MKLCRYEKNTSMGKKIVHTLFCLKLHYNYQKSKEINDGAATFSQEIKMEHNVSHFEADIICTSSLCVNKE